MHLTVARRDVGSAESVTAMPADDFLSAAEKEDFHREVQEPVPSHVGTRSSNQMNLRHVTWSSGGRYGAQSD